MTLITYKIAACFLIFFTSIISVAYPIHIRAYPKHHPFFELADAFASGIFLGAALFHMLPDAREDFLVALGAIKFPLAEAFCAFGFLVLLFLERISELKHNPNHAVPGVFVVILIIHALIEGGVIGVNQEFASALIIFFAIIAHKSSESFALAVVLNRKQVKIVQTIVIVSIFSLMTPLGIILGTAFAATTPSAGSKFIMGGFNAFAAGTFLYMSTLHHVNHHERHHKGEGLLEFAFLFGGLLVMAVIALWA